MSLDRTWQLLLCFLLALASCTDGPVGTPGDDAGPSPQLAPGGTRGAPPDTDRGKPNPDQPPAANPGGPYVGIVNTPLKFDGTGSADPDDPSHHFKYVWDFGDGSTGTGPRPSHTYTAAGTFTVTVVITNPDKKVSSAPASTTATILAEGNQAPIASPGGPYTAPVAAPVQFDGTASLDPDGGMSLVYLWDFGDGTPGSGATPTHAYAAPGSYKVSLTVTDATGLSSTPVTTRARIHAIGQTAPPVANPGGPYEAIVNMPVAFDGTASADPDGPTEKLTYAWDFGDGGIATGPAPSHTYTATGTYNVTLVVTDMKHAVSEPAATTVTVAPAPDVPPPNVAPVANPGGPYAGVAGTGIQFDGSTSSDADDNLPLAYAWDFGDGSTGGGARPTHVYAEPGVYTVTLTVTDALGIPSPSATTTATIEAPNQPPAAAAGGPYTGTAGTAVQFDGSGSADPDGNLPLTYAWDFGDGSTGSGATPTHTYAAPGTYTITLTVTDAKGLAGTSATTSATIEAPNQPPVAAAGGPYTGIAGSSVPFDGTGSSDPDGNVPLTYAWDFGDGSTASGATPTHTYAAPGTYTVSLTVTDAKGLAGTSATTSATIEAPNQAPVAAAGGPYTGFAGNPVTFDGTGSSDPDGNVPLTYAWNFGDGSTGSGATPAHTYATPGSYTVTLTVTDAKGLSGQATTAAVEIASSVLMLDTFTRVVAQTWGSADVGGGWFTSNSTDFSVDGAHGLITARTAGPLNVVGRGPVHGNPAMESYGLDVTGIASFRIDTPPAGTSAHTLQMYARRNDRITDGDNYYRFRVRHSATRMELSIEKAVNNVESVITSATTLSEPFDASARWWIRFEVFGTSPATTLRMRVWKDGTVEPSVWHSSTIVNEPALDLSGTTGFRFSTPSTQVNFPVRVEIDNMQYRRKSVP